MYISLDEKLVPGKLQDINEPVLLEGQTRKKESSRETHWKSTLNVQKYDLHQGSIRQILQEIEANPRPQKSRVDSWDSMGRSRTPSPIGKFEESSLVVVAGSDIEGVWFDYDLGFFSAILACYNNHWTLKTCPDDWWNTIARTIAQNVEENAEANKVRDFFVDHGDKKDIIINLPGKLDEVNYDWLFDQFARGIKSNIKTPGYVDQMVADFSTTGADQKISNQIMLMSSLSKYLKFQCRTLCGIPGVEMEGSLEDWQTLLKKTQDMHAMLKPILDEIDLEQWFESTLVMLQKLLDTFQGRPDVEWWSHILSWDECHGSGQRDHWSGKECNLSLNFVKPLWNNYRYGKVITNLFNFRFGKTNLAVMHFLEAID